ncbi:hypothetical protein NE865_02281 [Phthorimaea operculella]|nr:hypothetical protein NE865_02281 [Phthorimaea operculella]
MCELGTLILKTILIYEMYADPGGSATLKLGTDYGILLGFFIIETTRLILGRKGSLSERDIPVMFSVALTVPSILGVLYLLCLQVVVLRIEYIWCTLMFTVLVLEFIFACIFVVSMCRGPSYD